MTRRRGRLRRHLPALFLMLPLVFGMLGTPSSVPVAHGDELSDAKAKQAQLKKEVAAQKARVAELNQLQHSLASEISATRKDLRAVGADLNAVRAKIKKMETAITEVKAAYDALVYQLRYMNQELGRVTAQETAKRVQLGERRAQLADRVRNAYDTDRTSPLETFLSGGTFTDMLAEMSYYIDVGEQDKALAQQITRDQRALSAMHQTVAETKDRTDGLRLETAAQKRALDASLLALKETKAELNKLQKKVAKALREQKARYAALARNKSHAAAIIRKAAADQKKLANRIDNLIKAQVKKGNIPSKYNGTMHWPMSNFYVSGEYGCSSFPGYSASHGCAHYHNGIDLVGPTHAAIRAAAPGIVVVCGWNWADGADPAWIVVIAHSGNLRTWYAHMVPGCPARVGQHVSQGQLIGHQGSTGHATGAHLHWMVEFNGDWRNPRLFL